MNESPHWLKMLLEVAAEEAAAGALMHLDTAAAAHAQVMGGREGHRAYTDQRKQLLSQAGL